MADTPGSDRTKAGAAAKVVRIVSAPGWLEHAQDDSLRQAEGREGETISVFPVRALGGSACPTPQGPVGCLA